MSSRTTTARTTKSRTKSPKPGVHPHTKEPDMSSRTTTARTTKSRTKSPKPGAATARTRTPKDARTAPVRSGAVGVAARTGYAETEGREIHERFYRAVHEALADRRLELAALDISRYVAEVEALPLPPDADGRWRESGIPTLLFSTEFFALDERRRRGLVLSHVKITNTGTSDGERLLTEHFAGLMINLATKLRTSPVVLEMNHAEEQETFLTARLNLVATGRMIDRFAVTKHAKRSEWNGSLTSREFFAVLDPVSGVHTVNTTSSITHEVVHAMLFPHLEAALFTANEWRVENDNCEFCLPRIVRVRVEILDDAPVQPVPHHELSDVVL